MSEPKCTRINCTENTCDHCTYYHEYADIEPPKAEWFDKGSLSCRCSNCGCKSTKESNFCPNCGADMRGEENE